MDRITMMKDEISKELSIRLVIDNEKYYIELLDLTEDKQVSLKELNKSETDIESILKIYKNKKDSIIKEKYKDNKSFILKEFRINNRKSFYLKNNTLDYEIGYKVENDVAMCMSVKECKVIERISKCDISLDGAIDRYEQLKLSLTS